MVLDWAIGDETCKVAQNKKNYICGANTPCNDHNPINGPGYRCECKEGYLGNPYLKDGCQDIDECKGANNCTEKQICVNKPGYYECSCIKGYHMESVLCVSDQSSLAIHLAVGEYLCYISVYCTLSFLLTYRGFCPVNSISYWEG
ncbi:wall-associated receptor kinase 2-like [Quercus robur]|uniref:wall-associated receptor kinase 2-like n=1 Tax=Quercus robur TaxID=38942 RepID=UPI0021611521|nr:wall-associated receptor kinase 2-like [Quercus robur]